MGRMPTASANRGVSSESVGVPADQPLMVRLPRINSVGDTSIGSIEAPTVALPGRLFVPGKRFHRLRLNLQLSGHFFLDVRRVDQSAIARRVGLYGEPTNSRNLSER